MIISNKFNVHPIIYEWLKQDFYDTVGASGTYSITTLLKPVQEVILFRKYGEKIEVDCMELFYRVLGSSMHEAFDRIKLEGMKPVERLIADLNGVKVSGKFDVIYNNKLIDYKLTSAWSVVYGSKVEDWRFQLSGYRWLYWKAKGIKLEDVGSIIGLFRDWKASDAVKKGYPEHPILEMNVTLMSLDETELAIKKAVDKLEKYKDAEDGALPQCTPGDKWYNFKKKTSTNCDTYCTARDVCLQRGKKFVGSGIK